MLKTLTQTLKQHPNRRWIMVLVLLVVVVAVLMLMRSVNALLLRRETNENAVPLVRLIKAKHAPLKENIVLPGNVNAWHEAPIYARTNGYIKNWYVDIGSHVTKNQLLAKIETPELDAALRQAEADLQKATAQNKLAQTTATRWLYLRKTDSVSQQATDEKVDTALALAAKERSLRANRDRLKELVEFERVVAPFTGIISDRRTDIGALINSGSTPNEKKPLFRIVQINPLRVYVKIPQAYAALITPNMTVQLRFNELPGQFFPAKLLETSHAIDPLTRTLLAQFVVENKKGILLPGSYTQVLFTLPPSSTRIQLPVNTLIFRKEGLQVATLDKNHHVQLKNITIDTDFGNYVEIASGITLNEPIIINPSDAIYEGQNVRVAP